MNGFSRKTLVAVSLILMGTGSAVADHAWPVTPWWGWSGYARAGDFDRDGRYEIVSPEPTQYGTFMYIHRSTGSGFESDLLGTGAEWGLSNFIFVGDFNGDGHDDFASADGGLAYMRYGRWGLYTRGWAEDTVWISNIWGGADFTFAGDFNGDGFDDIASAHNDSVYMKFGSTRDFTSATWTVSNQWGNGAYSFAGDFNGDGFDDIASITSGTAYMKLSTGPAQPGLSATFGVQADTRSWVISTVTGSTI